MKKLFAVLAMGVALTGLMLSQAEAAKKIPVVVATSVDTDPQNYTNIFLKKFIELANQYSDGSFDFQHFPSGQLGDEVQTVRSALLGSINVTCVATNNFSPFAPSTGWVNMPYLFESLDQFRYLVDAMWDQQVEWGIKEGGMRNLAILDIGYRQLTTNAKHPVRNLEDAKGIKIRTPQNALMVSTFKALGLQPAAVSFAETFNALQQGVVDGQEGCFNNVVAMKFHEAQKYCTKINWAVHSCCWLVPEKWFQTLDKKQQDALTRAGHEAMLYERSLVADILKSDDDYLMSKGMVLLGEVEDLPKWFELGRNAWPKCYDVIGNGNAEKGKGIVDMVLAKVKK